MEKPSVNTPTDWQELPYRSFHFERIGPDTQFAGRQNWREQEILVILEVNDEENPNTPAKAAIATMHRLYLTPQRWEKRCTKAAYAELLQQTKSRKAKNRKTLVVDADGFRERLTPKRPECYFDGSFSIHFEYST